MSKLQSNEETKQKQSQVIDEFGFIQTKDKNSSSQQLDLVTQPQNNQKELKRLNARYEKWRQMLPNLTKLIKSNDRTLKSRVRKGIPSGIRLKIWPILADIDKIKQSMPINYQELVNNPNFPYQQDIELDLNRTYPNHYLFQDQKFQGIDSLRNILKALSISFEKMGYCQGINFIAATFLINMNDEDAFWLLFSLMQKYSCLEMYQDVGSVKKQLHVHQQLLKKFLPKVAAHLDKFQVEPIYYATSWYMTLFGSVLPFNYYMRVMDIFLLEGWKIIYRIALAYMKTKQNQILQAESFENLMLIMKDITNISDNNAEDKFFQTANNDFIFSKTLITKLIIDYESNNVIENKRENVPSGLKKKNSNKQENQ